MSDPAMDYLDARDRLLKSINQRLSRMDNAELAGLRESLAARGISDDAEAGTPGSGHDRRRRGWRSPRSTTLAAPLVGPARAEAHLGGYVVGRPTLVTVVTRVERLPSQHAPPRGLGHVGGILPK